MPKKLYGNLCAPFIRSMLSNMQKVAGKGCVLPPAKEQKDQGIDPNEAFREEVAESMLLLDSDEYPEVESEVLNGVNFVLPEKEKAARKLIQPVFDQQKKIEQLTPKNASLTKAANKMIEVKMDLIDAGANPQSVFALGTLYQFISNMMGNVAFCNTQEKILEQNAALDAMPVDVFQDAGAELWRVTYEYQMEKRKRPISAEEQKEFNRRIINHLDVLIEAGETMMSGRDSKNPPEGALSIFDTEG